jgi:hypothetical protein
VTDAPEKIVPASVATLPRIEEVVDCAIAADDNPTDIATAIAMRLSFVVLNIMCFLSFVYSERLVRQLSIWNADGLVLDSNRFLIPPNSSVTD